jgi:hypothetical protein
MMCWFLILGYLMGWFSPPRRDKRADAPAHVQGPPDAPSAIPPMFRAEPLVQEAEKLVRSRR